MPNLKINKARIFVIAGYVSLIYLTLPVMRPVLNFLKELLGSWFGLLTNAVLISGLSFIALAMVKQKISWQKWIMALIVFCLYAYTLVLLKIPEERIHLLEYGFLGFLVFNVYPPAWGDLSRYWHSFLTVSFFGTLDEIIQYFIPNRVGDVRDIILNIISGLLGLLLVAVFSYKSAKNLPNSPPL